MERTEHSATGGGVHRSGINTSHAPRVARSAKKRNLPCLFSMNYCQVPSATQVRSHGNVRISVLWVLSDGAV